MSGAGKKSLWNWSLTPWQMSGKGGWTTQPVILVEGQRPFFADHPDAYAAKLQELHDDPALMRGPFYACIGQLKDATEQVWNIKEASHA